MRRPALSEAIQAMGAVPKWRDDFESRLWSVWGDSPLYQYALRGPAPDRILLAPHDYRHKDASLGALIVSGRFKLPGATVVAPSADDIAGVWDEVAPGDPGYEALHGFEWLRHLALLQEAGRRAATALVAGWVRRYSKWCASAWAPALAAERLTAWMSYHGLFLNNDDPAARDRILASAGRQLRHLARWAARAPEGLPRLRAAAGLALAGCCLPNTLRARDRGLELLRRELQLQILPDGGHIGRNPSVQLDILLRLLALAGAMAAQARPAPAFLRHAIDRMTPMTRYFRHGDGRLGLFQGATEDDPEAIEAALANDDMHAKPFGFAPHSGYQRLAAGRALVLMDVGRPAPPPYGRDAHDSALAFEFSVGRHRLVVNCGAATGLDTQWRAALRRSDAHSRAIVSSSEEDRGWSGQTVIESRRFEDRDGYWLEAEQTGGLIVGAPEAVLRRRLYLSAAGDNLRGEDTMDAPIDAFEAAKPEMAVRFHLHPSVRASLARDQKSVLIIAPNGEGWRFRSDGEGLTLEKSIYLGDGERPRPCEQVVVRGAWRFQEGYSVLGVRWAFRRMGRADGLAGGYPRPSA